MGIVDPKLPMLSFLKNDQQSQNTSNTQHNGIEDTSDNIRNLRNFLQVTINSCYSNSESNTNSSIIKTCIDESQVNYCETMPGNKQHIILFLV
jgi:hypothetical protein